METVPPLLSDLVTDCLRAMPEAAGDWETCCYIRRFRSFQCSALSLIFWVFGDPDPLALGI